MKVIRVSEQGFCNGVRRALALVEKVILKIAKASSNIYLRRYY